MGDPNLRPVLEELDRRGATVFLHPTTPCCTLPNVRSYEHGNGKDNNMDLPSTTAATYTSLGSSESPNGHGARSYYPSSLSGSAVDQGV